MCGRKLRVFGRVKGTKRGDVSKSGQHYTHTRTKTSTYTRRKRHTDISTLPPCVPGRAPFQARFLLAFLSTSTCVKCCSACSVSRNCLASVKDEEGALYRQHQKILARSYGRSCHAMPNCHCATVPASSCTSRRTTDNVRSLSIHLRRVDQSRNLCRLITTMK